MRLLLDTHALLWWVHEQRMLSRKAHDVIANGANQVLVSAVSAMEIAIKARKERLEYPSTLASNFNVEVIKDGFEILAITSDHAQLAGGLIWDNSDPWDRLLAAQAKIENLTLVSNDSKMKEFGISQFW